LSNNLRNLLSISLLQSSVCLLYCCVYLLSICICIRVFKEAYSYIFYLTVCLPVLSYSNEGFSIINSFAFLCVFLLYKLSICIYIFVCDTFSRGFHWINLINYLSVCLYIQPKLIFISVGRSLYLFPSGFHKINLSVCLSTNTQVFQFAQFL
jgi:hypothetical protein